MVRFVLIGLLVLPMGIFSQDVSALLHEAQTEEFALKENEAFLKYAEVLKTNPFNLMALCKCSELSSLIGNRQIDRPSKIRYFKAANVYAAAALRVDPNNSEANFAMALAIGRQALVSSGKEKVMAVSDVKRFADRSVALDPRNFKAYHVLGKWNYEVSNLNFAEKAFAKWLYGGIPDASLKAAINNYEKSRSLNPNFVINYLELAKAYYRIDDKKKAVELLKYMMPLPNSTLDDPTAKEEGRRLLVEWRL